jgi:hypothetical protein
MAKLDGGGTGGGTGGAKIDGGAVDAAVAVDSSVTPDASVAIDLLPVVIDTGVADAPIGQDAPIALDTAKIDAGSFDTGFPVACLGNVSINFAALAPYWVDASTACGAASFASNALTLTRRGACSSVSAGGAMNLNPARWRLCGDFDVRVNFNLLDFTVPVGGSQGRYATIRASDPSGSDSITIERYDLPVGNNACGRAPSTETYKAWTTDSTNCGGSATFVATSDMTGAFRLTRTGATVTSYYLSGVDGGSGGSWVAVKSDTSMTTTPWTLGFYLGYDDGPDATDMSVAFSSLDVVSASAP